MTQRSTSRKQTAGASLRPKDNFIVNKTCVSDRINIKWKSLRGVKNMAIKKTTFQAILLLLIIVLLMVFTGNETIRSSQPVTMNLEHRDQARHLSMRLETVDKVLIYKWNNSYEELESQAPLLTIDSKDGLLLFAT